MKVLIVDEEIPFPLNTGKRIRTYNLLKYLAKTNEITFVCQQHQGIDDNSPAALKEIGVRPVVVQNKIRSKGGMRFYFALLLNLFSRYPYSVSSHYSKELIGKIKNLLSNENFDLIHCEWTPYAINLKNFFHYPTIVDAHNVEALIWKRSYEVEKNLLKKYYIFFQWKKMEWYEKGFFPKFAQTISVSDNDREIINSWIPDTKVKVIPNGVDTNFFKQSDQIKEEEYNLVFTGSMDWRPNIDGILYFLDQIWPIVVKANPSMKFYVVGRNPDAALVNRVKRETNVFLTGTVDDVRPYIDRANVFIVPLRFGGGSRLKILEALSMNKPVISTTVGAEGLELKNGRDILIEDTPHLFAEKIIDLCNNKELREKLSKNGNEIINKKYKWSVISKELNKLWGETVECHS